MHILLIYIISIASSMHFSSCCRHLWRYFTVMVVVKPLSDIYHGHIAGAILWWACHHRKEELRSREGFLIVVAFWVVMGSLGANPILYFERPDLTISSAFFESFSGLTTTVLQLSIGSIFKRFIITVILVARRQGSLYCGGDYSIVGDWPGCRCIAQKFQASEK